MPRLCAYILFLCGILCNKSLGQTIVYASSDTAYFNSGSIAHINFTVKNEGHQLAYYHTGLQSPFQLISKLPGLISIPPGDSLLIPVELYIPRKAPAEVANTIHLSVITDDTFKNLAQATTVAFVNPRREVFITALQQELFLHDDAPLTVDVRCNNIGNVGSKVNITLSDATTQTRHPSTTSFYIRRFTDTVLHIKYKVSSAIKNTQLKVTATYNNNVLFSAMLINVYNVSSEQKYIADDAPVLDANGNNNMVGLFARYMGSPYKYYELVADGADNFSAKNGFAYHADALFYPGMMGSGNSLLLMNTYLSYHDNVWGMKIGSVYENLEMPLFGRGATFQFRIKKKASFEVGYVNSNYNLAGAFQNGYYKYSNSLFATYNDALSDLVKIKAQYIQCWDPENEVNYAIAGSNIAIQSHSKKQELIIGAFGSYSTTGAYLPIPNKQLGEAGKLQYDSKFSSWQLSSSNYFSSRQYAGVQKGAVNLDEKLIYAPGNKWDSWVRYNKYANAPEYISPLYEQMNNNFYYVETAEIGTSKKMGKNLQLTFKPYYYHEYNRSIYNFTDSVELHAERADITLNYTGFKDQLLSFDGDMGTYNTNLFTGNYLCWKINASWQYRQFSCNTFLQNGPYYVGDLSLYPLMGKPYKTYSINPGYSGLLFKKLQLSFNDFIAYQYLDQRWSNNITIHGNYPLPHNFALDVNYNRLQLMAYQHINALDVGIIKKFANTKQKARSNSQLEITFFDDINGNEVQDNDELYARDILVKINDELFWTDNNGTIIYDAIPKGDYQVTIINGNGFYTNVQLIYVDGKTKIMVPLHKMGMIKGRLTLQHQELSYDIDGNIAGISIIATDKQGKAYHAVTNEKGEFIFYLPENDYNVQIDRSSLPDKYELPDISKNIKVSTTEPSSDWTIFNVKVQKRQMKIRKFTSVSMKQ